MENREVLFRRMFIVVCVLAAVSLSLAQPMEQQQSNNDCSFSGMYSNGNWLASNNGFASMTDGFSVTDVDDAVALPAVSLSKPSGTTFTLPYGAAEMNVTLPEPTFTPVDGSFTLENDLVNPLSAGNHSVTWTLKDARGNTLATATQNVKVEMPECGTSVMLDGYKYPVVRVGYDCWFKENVKASTGIDGAVAYMQDPANKDKFGLLYSWQSAVAGSAATPNIQGICPNGWGIPTVEDLQNLYANANNDLSRLKDSDPTAWTAGKGGKTPSTGFDLLGAGYFESEQNSFEDLLKNTILWTSSAGATNGTAVCCEFNDYCQKPMFKEVSALDKVSVRCIRKN